MEIRYPALLEPQQPEGFLVTFPDLDDAFTEGKTEEEALFNAAEVLTAMLEWRLDHGKPVPEPSKGIPGAHEVAPDARMQAAILMRLARGERPVADFLIQNL
ncbi:MAG: type II toxin-antitoxin system HicB family antitoxin [Magnetococcales bacterium]|nr:type II toxin-antitoxin system HicB family antitoxin [Magnetococcales bacterium]